MVRSSCDIVQFRRNSRVKVAMMQPSFLPWLGYFELIYRADRFVFGDDSQFSVGSYHQRNRLFTGTEQVDWYVVPVNKKESFGRPLNETKTSEQAAWRQKMWRQVSYNYGRAPFFGQIAPAFERLLLAPAESLAVQNMAFIRLACDLMGIQREFLLSSQLPPCGVRSQRVLELLRWCECDEYLCARGSFDYMKEDGVFPMAEITVRFQDFHATPYSQTGGKGKFYPNLSVFDSLFNVGPEETLKLIEAGTPKWLAWDEMLFGKAADEVLVRKAA
jgi:hypothetical protein